MFCSLTCLIGELKWVVSNDSCERFSVSGSVSTLRLFLSVLTIKISDEIGSETWRDDDPRWQMMLFHCFRVCVVASFEMRLADGGNGNAAALRWLDLLAEPEYANYWQAFIIFIYWSAGGRSVCQSSGRAQNLSEIYGCISKMNGWAWLPPRSQNT